MKNFLFHTYKEVNKLLDASDRKKQKWVIFFSFVNSAFEIIGLSTLIPIMSIALSNNIEENVFYLFFERIYGVETLGSFLLLLGIHITLIIIIKNILSLIISHKIGAFAYNTGKKFSLKALKSKYQLDYLKLFSDNSHKHVWEVNALPQFFVNFSMLQLYKLFNEIVIIALIFIALILQDPISLVLIGLAIAPATILFYRLVKNKLQSYEQERAHLQPKLNSNVQQMIYGFTDVQITGTEKSFMDQFDRMTDQMKRLNTNLFTYGLAPQKVIETAIILGVLALIAYGVLYIDEPSEFNALLTLYAVAAFKLGPSTNKLMVSLMNMKKYSYTIERMKEVHNREGYVEKNEVNSEPLDFNSEVKLENITFSYDNDSDKVLDGINFNIQKGKSIGIVGKSGSGKSTLMKLILGFLDPKEGQISIDGVKLTKKNLFSWRKIIGYVSQDFFIIEGSIRENVAFGVEEKDIDDALVERSIDMASLKDFVAELPNGIHTEIGERGSQISGGQKQRIAIARALYSGASILFFDEATSALDAETEQEITESIRKIGKGMEITTVIIAHNRQTLKYCDQVIEMEKGKITNTEIEIE